MTARHRLAATLDPQSRRDFLVSFAAGLLGLGLAPALVSGLGAEEPAPNDPPPRRPTAKNLIYCYMAGGMSHLDTFDVKPGVSEQGPVEAIATKADGVQIAHYLPLLAAQMDQVAIINSLTSTQGAHEQGNYFMHTSYVKRGTIQHPALGSWVSRLQGRRNATLPASVTVGAGNDHPGSGWMESIHAPLPLGRPDAGLQHSNRPRGISEERYRKRLELAETFNARFRQHHDSKKIRAYRDLYDEALALMQSDDLSAFDIRSEDAAVRERYGDSPFGQGCLLARRLVEHDVRAIEVNLGGWDTHNDNFERVAEQAAILDRGLSALLEDLHRRGLLEETLVVVATEFGRKPKLNQNGGRDHHPKCFSCLLAGGGVRGGQRFGASDQIGYAVAERKVTVPDFNATIAYALGLDVERIVYSPSRRPFQVADGGRPLVDLF